MKAYQLKELIDVNKRAVTLIEILISFTILALVAGALSSGTNYLTRKLVHAEQADIARQLAWSRLAEVKAQPILFGHFQGNFGENFPNFTYDETIAQADYNGRKINGLFSYELSIMWNQAYKLEKIKLKTLISESAEEKKE